MNSTDKLSLEEMVFELKEAATDGYDGVPRAAAEAIIAALRAGQEMRDAIREPNLGNAQYAAQAWDAETKGDEG